VLKRDQQPFFAGFIMNGAKQFGKGFENSFLVGFGRKFSGCPQDRF
jgi:hypothetical protein